MHDHQRIVDDLRAALYAYTPAMVEQLRALVEVYGEALREVNARLQRCGELLRQGLRSEAIQLAEIQPRVLDLVAGLDFPEREPMGQFLAERGISAPPALLIDVAAELNEAYAIEEPLRVLLDRHRRLALSRASLSDRIGVLRTIAKTDSNNVVWQEDLQTYELERVKQIEREIGVALQEADTATLTALEDELETETWIERPPAALVRQAREARARHTRIRAREELDELEPQLNDAFAAFDVARGRELRSRWERAVAQAEVSTTDATVERAGPALAWLSDQDEQERRAGDFAAAVANLESALDKDTPAVELERLYHTAARFGDDIPAVTERRLNDRLQSAELGGARRARLITSVVIASILVVGAGVGWTIWWFTLTAEINARRATLAQLLDQGKHEAASQYLAELENDSPRVATSDEIQALRAKLSGLLAADKERGELFRQNLAAVGAPEQADHAALSRARKLAKTGSEKAQLLEVETAVNRAAAAAQRLRDEKFTEQLSVLTAQLVAFEQASKNGSATQQNRIRELQSTFRAAQSNAAAASTSLREQFALLSDRLTTLENELARRVKEAELIASAAEAIGDRDAYYRRLNEFIEQFPQSARAADFRRVVDEAAMWEAIDSWNALADTFSGDLDSFRPEKAAQAISQINAVLEKHGTSPAVENYRQRLAFLEAIGKRLKDGERIEKALFALFNNMLVADLWMVELKDGKRYYTRQEPKLSGAVPTIKYLASLDNTEKTVAVKPINVAYVGPAPQRKLGDAVRARLRTLADETWDRNFYGIVLDIIRDDRTDALLRLQLLERVIEVACEGSHLLAESFKSYRSEMANAGINLFSNWLDPADAEANRNRDKAEQLITDLRNNNEPARRIAELRRSLAVGEAAKHQWVGLLLRDAEGTWTVAAPRPPSEAGKVYLIVQSVKDGPIAIKEIGTAEKGRFVVGEVLRGLAVEGRPVFVAVASDSLSTP